MWNGPTWPHANSLVLSAMARTLRENERAQLALKREHFWELFDSFTRAQFRNQQMDRPWTGEFYRGDNAEWKTAERDYFHSTWLDVLVGDVIGIAAEDSPRLVVSPLIPPRKLSHFLLDGQPYRGHDITVVWDDPEQNADQYGDNRKGLDVYVDGALRAESPTLTRLEVALSP